MPLLKRQRTILPGFRPPEILQFFQFSGILIRYIDLLGEILINMIQLPLVRIEFRTVFMDGYSSPAVLEDGTVTPEAEKLGVPGRGRFRIVEGTENVCSMHVHLFNPVKLVRSFDIQYIQYSRGNVNHLSITKYWLWIWCIIIRNFPVYWN